MSIKLIDIPDFTHRMAYDHSPASASRTLDDHFTTKTLVFLYEVNSRGHRVECDMYHENLHDRWSKEHGLFAKETVAQRKEIEVTDTLIREGYSRGRPGHLYRKYHDAYVTVEKLEVDQEDIAVDERGNYSYQGKEVTL